MLRIVEQIKEGFNPREYTRAVFPDVAKAFDKVWQQGLLLKMHRAGISKATVRLIHSYLRKRTFKIKLEGQRSTVRTATAGVPQGTADDVCIFLRSFNVRVIDRLQTALGTLQDWHAKWRIAVHLEKSTGMLFSIGGR
ncbi:hypothetical protein Trydic_g2191 [Trypoxylus dichotomus]